MAKTQAYNDNSITKLEGPDRVRKRPAVIFGTAGLEGCQHSVFEILSNSVDKARSGYGKLIRVTMFRDKNIKVKLNTDFKDVDTSKFDRVFYTGPIDEYFNYEFGQLPYRSVNFKFETYDKPYYQSNACVNYPCNYDFTRIHEYKYYLDDKSEKTVIAKEYSEFFELGKNERYYPIPKDENTVLYNKYLEKSKSLKNVYFLGRLGDYKYYDMDKAILRAIELFEEISK